MKLPISIPLTLLLLLLLCSSFKAVPPLSTCPQKPAKSQKKRLGRSKQQLRNPLPRSTSRPPLVRRAAWGFGLSLGSLILGLMGLVLITGSRLLLIRFLVGFLFLYAGYVMLAMALVGIVAGFIVVSSTLVALNATTDKQTQNLAFMGLICAVIGLVLFFALILLLF